jgi:glutamate-5-semialdehyde dehydrogenase
VILLISYNKETMEKLNREILQLGHNAKEAARKLSHVSAEIKNKALETIAEELENHATILLFENQKDIKDAREKGLSSAMIDRLTLTKKRIQAMAQGVREVAALQDPVGEIIREWDRPNGLHIVKRRVPIGVIGIIYESRPNVTCDAAVLCLKTGNATILRGGSEALHSNQAIVYVMGQALAKADLPSESIQLVASTDRDAVKILCEMDSYLDVIIPRGGHSLIETVVSHARMPVIKHYHGVCHVFVDRDADLEMAEKIVVNAKCQRPGVCNAMETLLVDEAIAEKFLPQITKNLIEKGVELRGDAASRKIVASMKEAKQEDWTTEYLDLILSVRIVNNVDAAIDHLERFGSHHSDAIVTKNKITAERFLNEVDSATVYWNASTRFTDGGEFGFGAEIGISTDKLHARGPMGLEELTTYKYQIIGSGQIRS